MENKESFIVDKLNTLYSDPKTFLTYSKDYELLFAIILSAQAKDEIVNKCTSILYKKYSKLIDFNEDNLIDIESIIKPIGLYKTKASNIINSAKLLIEKYNGCVPKNRDILETFPGVGHKTSGVFLGEFYDFKYIPVDTHIARVTKRLYPINPNASNYEIENFLESKFDITHPIVLHKQLILLGRNLCKIKPNCSNCPLKEICSYYSI